MSLGLADGIRFPRRPTTFRPRRDDGNGYLRLLTRASPSLIEAPRIGVLCSSQGGVEARAEDQHAQRPTAGEEHQRAGRVADLSKSDSHAGIRLQSCQFGCNASLPAGTW